MIQEKNGKFPTITHRSGRTKITCTLIISCDSSSSSSIILYYVCTGNNYVYYRFKGCIFLYTYYVTYPVIIKM